MRANLVVNSTKSQRILFVNVDGNPVYGFTPSTIPQGRHQILFEFFSVPMVKGKHLVEMVTDHGEYISAEVVL